MWEKWEYIYSEQLLYISLLVFPLHSEWNVRENKRKAARDVWPRWTRVLPRELANTHHGPGTVPKLVLEHQQKAIFRLVPMPGHGAQISARAPTKGYIQTGAHARARCPN